MATVLTAARSKITLGEMRESGVRDLLVFCQDYRCSRNVKLSAVYVDRWPDKIRLPDLEPRFICQVCGKRGAILRGGSNATRKAIRFHDEGLGATVRGSD
ncbi:hypothetical protein [Bradyrhizobium sp. McL0616]|uniref:hypothetical protein n=1 Tax=Bradyrhizobium sp. McL0616 TaxID=3415674 RepID=UPI003CF75DE3